MIIVTTIIIIIIIIIIIMIVMIIVIIIKIIIIIMSAGTIFLKNNESNIQIDHCNWNFNTTKIVEIVWDAFAMHIL